jgi:adenosylcobinamide-phosphate synthase
MTPAQSRALGLAAGFLADRLLGDPRRGHPVAGFGRVATALEDRLYADRRREGAVFTTILVGSAAVVGVAADRLTRERPVAHALAVAAATWTVLGGRSLGREALAVSRLLDGGEIVRARVQVTHLVGRDTSGLGPDEIARATVESVAENTSDAVVGPLVAGALLGVPGLLAYRAANTLDAMVGHHSPRYERFGWASARLDDLLNVAPARLSGVFASALAPLVGGRPVDAVTSWRRDAAGHPSPNAGVVEAAFAGALGVTLGGRNVYGDQVENRAELGSGPPPCVADVARAMSLAEAVGWMALAVAVSAALAPRPRRRRDR